VPRPMPQPPRLSGVGPYHRPRACVSPLAPGLGRKQDGRPVREAVELPPWANGSPAEFVRPGPTPGRTTDPTESHPHFVGPPSSILLPGPPSPSRSPVFGPHTQNPVTSIPSQFPIGATPPCPGGALPRVQRAALEGAVASAGLPAWIDLVFGCRQRGAAALAHDNAFHPLTYEDAVDLPAPRHRAEVHHGGGVTLVQPWCIRGGHPHLFTLPPPRRCPPFWEGGEAAQPLGPSDD